MRTKCEKLIDACRVGEVGEVKDLLIAGAEPRSLGAIHLAAARGKDSIVRALLDAGVPVDIRNAVGQTALHCGSRNGHHVVVRQLLDSGADVYSTDESGQTALHGAAGHGHEAILRTLLDAGADLFAEDLDGSTAAYFALRRNHKSVEVLLECRGNATSETS